METVNVEVLPKKEPFGRNGGRKDGIRNHKIAHAIGLIANSGLDPREAYMIATGKDSVSKSTLSRLKDKVQRWSLKHPASLKAASKSIVAFAKGEEINGISPKCSTVLAAAQRIVDATEPIVRENRNLNVNLNTDICPVDMTLYR